MIPKIIHYCWFGHSQLPEIVQKCIESWRVKMPDYEIKRWDETNIDVEISPFMLTHWENMLMYPIMRDIRYLKIMVVCF